MSIFYYRMLIACRHWGKLGGDRNEAYMHMRNIV